jgi:nucleotide-binding universal stress UspA family protein
MKILVGVDGRDESAEAVGLATSLAQALGAGIEAAAVLDYSPLSIDFHPDEAALSEHFNRVFAAAGEAAGGFPLGEHRLTGSSPARALTELADEIDAALIVVGSTHRGLLGRVMPGTTADSLLTGAGCPVVVAPRGEPGGETAAIGEIGVGYDGGPEAELALALAAVWAKHLEAKLRLIGVVSDPGPLIAEVVSPVAYADGLRIGLTKALAAAAGRIEKLEVETELATGEPAEVLADATVGLDLLVLGSRGYGPVDRALLGSISSKVMRNAACPVAVVPRAAAD